MTEREQIVERVERVLRYTYDLVGINWTNMARAAIAECENDHALLEVQCATMRAALEVIAGVREGDLMDCDYDIATKALSALGGKL